MHIMTSAVLLAAAVALGAALQIWLQPQHATISAEFAADGGCEFVTLSRGRTCYRLEGAEDGELVVLVHGFSGSLRNFDAVSQHLQRHGKRVLSFDLFGRGFSDTAGAANDLALFVGQLAELVLALQPRIRRHGKFDLVGLSMGGPISAHFTVTYPHMVERLVLIAPAGLAVEEPITAKLSKLPLVGDLAMYALGPLVLQSHSRKCFHSPDKPESRRLLEAIYAMGERVLRERPGYLASLLSTLRHFPLQAMQDTYRRLGSLDLPQHVLWGVHDQVCPYSNKPVLQELLPHATFHDFANSGHIPFVEDKEEFMGVIATLLAPGRRGAD